MQESPRGLITTNTDAAQVISDLTHHQAQLQKLASPYRRDVAYPEYYFSADNTVLLENLYEVPETCNLDAVTVHPDAWLHTWMKLREDYARVNKAVLGYKVIHLVSSNHNVIAQMYTLELTHYGDLLRASSTRRTNTIPMPTGVLLCQ